MRWKLLLPIMLLLLFLIPQSSQTEGSDCYLSINADQSIGFGADASYYVLVEVTSGSINSTYISYLLDNYAGEFRFNSNVTGTLHFSDPAADYDLSAAGGAITIDEATGHIDDTFAAGDLVVLTWSIPLTPTLPLMFILGMVGLGSMMGGSMFTVYQLKQGEYLDAIKTGVVFFFIGLGLFMAWLIA